MSILIENGYYEALRRLAKVQLRQGAGYVMGKENVARGSFPFLLMRRTKEDLQNTYTLGFIFASQISLNSRPIRARVLRRKKPTCDVPRTLSQLNFRLLLLGAAMSFGTQNISPVHRI